MTPAPAMAGTFLTLGGQSLGEPYAGAIRALTAAEYAALRDDIAARGVLVPVVLDEDDNVLDGHHRLKAARELGLETVPVAIRVGLAEEEKEALAHDLNDHRRHLSMEEQRQRAAERRERVVRRREEGRSVRTIGREEGVSHVQVWRDLQEGGGGDVTPVTSPVAVQARNGQGRRTPRPGIGAQILSLVEQHPDWEHKRVAEEADVDPSYVGAVIRSRRRNEGDGQSAAARPRRTLAPGSTKDDEAVRRATVAHALEGLRWQPLEALLSFAVQEQLSAKRLLRLCREIRRDGDGGGHQTRTRTRETKG